MNFKDACHQKMNMLVFQVISMSEETASLGGIVLSECEASMSRSQKERMLHKQENALLTPRIVSVWLCRQECSKHVICYCAKPSGAPAA